MSEQLTEEMGANLADLGGLLRCTSCGCERSLGDIGSHLRSGWPKCCGLTMRWVTQRELQR